MKFQKAAFFHFLPIKPRQLQFFWKYEGTTASNLFDERCRKCSCWITSKKYVSAYVNFDCQKCCFDYKIRTKKTSLIKAGKTSPANIYLWTGKIGLKRGITQMNSLRNYERSQFYVCFIRKKGFLKMLGKPIEDVFGGTRFSPNFTRNRICHACFMENSEFFKITVSQMEAAVHTLFYKQLGSDPQTSKLLVLFKIFRD